MADGVICRWCDAGIHPTSTATRGQKWRADGGVGYCPKNTGQTERSEQWHEPVLPGTSIEEIERWLSTGLHETGGDRGMANELSICVHCGSQIARSTKPGAKAHWVDPTAPVSLVTSCPSPNSARGYHRPAKPVPNLRKTKAVEEWLQS